eukprot:Skav204869  [mRNA]  locus=scaffold1679:90355:90648:- [translate_table: standard]
MSTGIRGFSWKPRQPQREPARETLDLGSLEEVTEELGEAHVGVTQGFFPSQAKIRAKIRAKTRAKIKLDNIRHVKMGAGITMDNPHMSPNAAQKPGA